MASIPRHLAYNTLPDRYDPTTDTTLVDMGDILSSPVSSYNGDGEPCCETSDIKEEACTCTSKWLSQTRLRIIALTDANEALTLDSQQAHARIKQLEDQYQGRPQYGNSNNYQGQYHNQSNENAHTTRNINPAANFNDNATVNEQVRAALQTAQQVKREAHQAAATANARIAQLNQQLRAAVETTRQLKREASVANNRVAQLNDALVRSRNHQDSLPFPPGVPHVQNQQLPPFDPRFPNQEEFPEFPGFVPPAGGQPMCGAFHQHPDPAFQSRVGQLEQSHEALTAQLRDAVRRTSELKEAARRDAINAGNQLNALRRANVAQDARFTQLSEKHARLLADFAMLGNELDMARGHMDIGAHSYPHMVRGQARAIRSMDSGAPPHPHIVRGLQAEAARVREAQMRENYLSRANAALDLAARAGTHRMEREFSMRNAREARFVEESRRAKGQIERLRAENRALGSEVLHRRQREAGIGSAGAGMRHVMETRSRDAQLGQLREENRALGSEVVQRRQREAAIGMGAEMERERAREEIEHLREENRALGSEVVHRRQRESGIGTGPGMREAMETRSKNGQLGRLREENQVLGSEVAHRRHREAANGPGMGEVIEARIRNAQLNNVLDATRRQMMVLSEANALKEARLVEVNERASEELNRIAMDNRALTSQYRSAKESAAGAMHEVRDARARQNEMSNELDVTRRRVMELSEATRPRRIHSNEMNEQRLANTESNNRGLAAELGSTRNRVRTMSSANALRNQGEAQFAQVNERTNAELALARTECANARKREADAMDEVMEARAVHDEITHQLDATRRRVMVLAKANAVKNARESHLVEMNERANQHVLNLETDNRLLNSECMRGREREVMAMDEAHLRNVEQRNVLDGTRDQVKVLADANALKTMRGNRYIEMGERAKEELANLQTDYRVLSTDAMNGRVREAAAADEAVEARRRHLELANLLQNTQQRVFALSEANENLSRMSAAAHERVAHLENLLEEKERLLREWEAEDSDVSGVEYGTDTESDLEQAEWEVSQANERSVRLEVMTREAKDELNDLKAAYRALNSECIGRRTSENSALEELREYRARHTEVCSILNATRRRVQALNDANGNLASDSAAAHHRVTALERTLDEKEQVISDWERENKDVAEVRQALETAKVAQVDATRRCTELQEVNRELRTKCTRLEAQLNAANSEKNAAIERVEHLEQAQEDLTRQLRAAGRRADELKRAAQVATVNAANQLTALRRANSDLDVRHGGLCERYARLLAQFAILGNELDIARGHARAMRHPVNIIAGAPSIAVRALRAELQLNAAQHQESRVRERSLAAANAALDLAARAEAHRAEMEHALKNAREERWREVSESFTGQLERLKADYRVLAEQNHGTKEREHIAREEAASARATAESLSKANSQLIQEIRAAAERTHAAEMQRNVMQHTAQRVGALTSVVARLRARCADLCRRIPEERERIEHGDNADGEEREEDERICVIDMEAISRGDTVLALPCSHLFHRDCILPYLEATRAQGADAKCPLCRSVVDVPLDDLPVWNWGTDDERDIAYIDSDFSSNVATVSTTIGSFNGAPATGTEGTQDDAYLGSNYGNGNSISTSNGATAI